MIRLYSSPAFGQQLELGGALGHDAPRGLVEPVEARVEPGIATGGVAGQREMAVEPRVDPLGLSMQAKQQELGRGFGEMGSLAS